MLLRYKKASTSLSFIQLFLFAKTTYNGIEMKWVEWNMDLVFLYLKKKRLN